MTKFSAIVDNELKVDKMFDICDVSKTDDVLNIVVVNVDFDVLSNDRLDDNVIKKILNRRRKLLDKKSSDEC